MMGRIVSLFVFIAYIIETNAFIVISMNRQ